MRTRRTPPASRSDVAKTIVVFLAIGAFIVFYRWKTAVDPDLERIRRIRSIHSFSREWRTAPPATAREFAERINTLMRALHDASRELQRNLMVLERDTDRCSVVTSSSKGACKPPFPHDIISLFDALDTDERSGLDVGDISMSVCLSKLSRGLLPWVQTVSAYCRETAPAGIEGHEPRSQCDLRAQARRTLLAEVSARTDIVNKVRNARAVRRTLDPIVRDEIRGVILEEDAHMHLMQPCVPASLPGDIRHDMRMAWDAWREALDLLAVRMNSRIACAHQVMRLCNICIYRPEDEPVLLLEPYISIEVDDEEELVERDLVTFLGAVVRGNTLALPSAVTVHYKTETGDEGQKIRISDRADALEVFYMFTSSSGAMCAITAERVDAAHMLLQPPAHEEL